MSEAVSRFNSRFRASRASPRVIGRAVSAPVISYRDVRLFVVPLSRGACSLPSSVHASRLADHSLQLPAHCSSPQALPCLVIP